MTRTHQPSLADVVDLAVQLERDADEPHATLHQRDRRWLSGLSELPTAPRQRLLAWLEWLRADTEALPGRRVSAGYRLVLLGLVVAGMAVGSAVASAVFRYDGLRPVNVVHVLAVFVAAQVALLGLVGLVMLPTAWLRRIPGAAAFQETLATLSPGQAVRWVRRRLPAQARDAAAAGRAEFTRGWRPFESVWKWAGLAGAQAFAVAFNAGALATALYLVTFSDLAFAWSTTLRPDVDRVHRLTRVVATPWARLVPSAVPSLELVRGTLYYRHEPMATTPRPEGWGGWWPFLLAAMGTYGALPRVVLLGWSLWNLERELRRVLGDSAEARVVLDRLNTSWVSTQATSEEPLTELEAGRDREVGGAAFAGGGRVAPVNWGGLAVEDEALRAQSSQYWRSVVGPVSHAGGNSPLAVDEATIAALARGGDDETIGVFVKGWEPPLLECLDFLRALRQAGGPHRRIVVLPVSLGGDRRIRRCSEDNLRVWQRKLRSLGDPALSVAAWPQFETEAASAGRETAVGGPA